MPTEAAEESPIGGRTGPAELTDTTLAAGYNTGYYSPLAQGLLSGKFEAGNVPRDVRRNNTLFLPENVERATPLLDALRERLHLTAIGADRVEYLVVVPFGTRVDVRLPNQMYAESFPGGRRNSNDSSR